MVGALVEDLTDRNRSSCSHASPPENLLHPLVASCFFECPSKVGKEADQAEDCKHPEEQDHHNCRPMAGRNEGRNV